MRLATVVTAATALLLAGSTGIPEPAVWDEPANYSFEVTVTGSDLPVRTWNVCVRDHEVASLRTPSTLTLAKLVAEYNEAIVEDPGCSGIRFDPETGAPSWISINWCDAPHDGGMDYTIDAFEPGK